MSSNGHAPKITFANGREKRTITVSHLADQVIQFLECYGGSHFLGDEYARIIGAGRGAEKFQRLLEKTGYENDLHGFFERVVRYLEQAGGRRAKPLQISGITLPPLLLVSLLAELIPGNGFVAVKDVAQLEQLTNVKVSGDERPRLQAVIDAYPVRLSMHVVRQMRVSPGVARQYLPFVGELDPAGHKETWVGQFRRGLLEQMYPTRVVFLLNMTCPVYCRFCFRKHKELRHQPNPSIGDVKRAIEHVKKSPAIKEVLITGGDPFLNRSHLECAIDGLQEIPHVQILRLATRSIAYYPDLFRADNARWLRYLKMKSMELQLKEKRLEVATHFIHPDEVSPESLDIISGLVKGGIPVYVQTPFLKGCNDNGPELVRLFSLLRAAGAELHYLFIPCSPIRGSRNYWTPISKGLEAVHYLRAFLSDRAIPRTCTATSVGKIDWHSSGWAVNQDPEDERYIWLRTPYSPDYFKGFGAVAGGSNDWKVNEEGTIDVRFMAEIGDSALFLGGRRARAKKTTEKNPDQRALKALQVEAAAHRVMRRSIVETKCNRVFRLHMTRVELETDAQDADLKYIRKNSRITDVIVASQKDVLEDLHRVARLVEQLRDIEHIRSVRLRSLAFNTSPRKITRLSIEHLVRLNDLNVCAPLRLEIETRFLHSSEILKDHQELARALADRGITVYANTPLLGSVNDTPDEILRIAARLREAGIEFHHLYVAGLPLQEMWNKEQPVDVSDVIDIAGRLRCYGRGRGIPRIIIQTCLGEVDFGLTSKLVREGSRIRLRLNPYDLDYYRSMDPGFAWPAGVEADQDGKPWVVVPGLMDSGGFLTF